MLLDSYLPNYLIREVHHFAVKTMPAETYHHMCGFDMAAIPWIRLLFQTRTFLSHKNDKPFRLTLTDAYDDSGFVLLKEVRDRELVVGAIGKIWRPALTFEKVRPDEFAEFHKAGFGKVAWSLRCESRTDGGTLGTFELRVSATDAPSSAKMRAYYSMIGPFSRAIRRSVLSRVTGELGDLFAQEEARTLPGDSIIETPVGSATHGITIEAPPEAIWPWLAQMGNLRAGWYSYDWLDNGGIPSSFRIMPEWQHLKQGDILPATPQVDGKFLVVDSRPPNGLILGGCVNTDSGETLMPDVQPLPENYFRSTWAFLLEPQTENVTRLIVRARGDFPVRSKLVAQFRKMFLDSVHDFMERRQLNNLKKRAEQIYLLSPRAA